METIMFEMGSRLKLEFADGTIIFGDYVSAEYDGTHVMEPDGENYEIQLQQIDGNWFADRHGNMEDNYPERDISEPITITIV